MCYQHYLALGPYVSVKSNVEETCSLKFKRKKWPTTSKFFMTFKLTPGINIIYDIRAHPLPQPRIHCLNIYFISNLAACGGGNTTIAH